MTPRSEVEKPTFSVSPSPRDSQPTEQELCERYEEQQRRLACPGCGEEPFMD